VPESAQLEADCASQSPDGDGGGGDGAARSAAAARSGTARSLHVSGSRKKGRKPSAGSIKSREGRQAKMFIFVLVFVRARGGPGNVPRRRRRFRVAHLPGQGRGLGDLAVNRTAVLVGVQCCP